MNCKDVVGSLVDYLGGDMSLQAFQELEEHLKGCPDCRGFANTYQGTITLFRRVLLEEVPPRVMDRWRAHLRWNEGPDSPFEAEVKLRFLNEGDLSRNPWGVEISDQGDYGQDTRRDHEPG